MKDVFDVRGMMSGLSLAGARKRLQAILNGDEGSLTGGKSEKEQLEGKVTEGREQKGASQGETQKRVGAVKPQGTFYAKAASALRSNMMEQRMFMATQEIEKHTKKAAELLKDMGGGGALAFQ